MIDKANEMKLAAAGILAALTALWGWFGWLVILWIGCMAADYLTGTLAACREGRWNSAAARDGIWHKLGSILAVLVAGLMDIVLGVIVNSAPQSILPFEYGVFLCPMVLVWYIVTDLGSMVENAGKMGAPVPEFLRKAIAMFEDAAKTAGERVVEEEKLEKPDVEESQGEKKT